MAYVAAITFLQLLPMKPLTDIGEYLMRRRSFSRFHCLCCATVMSVILLSIPSTGSAITYTYDKLNRLTSVTYGHINIITYSYDLAGNRVKQIVTRGNGDGDINSDNAIDVSDAMLGLKILVGMSPSTIHITADVDGDGKIGLVEEIYILRKTSGLP